MNYWYFRFEGVFKPEHEENALMGVFSSCLIPESNRKHATSLFEVALAENHIDLVKIVESFPVDGNALDPREGRNSLWIRWYRRAQDSGEVEFDPWHVFDPKNEEQA